jgi:hypothetical protein
MLLEVDLTKCCKTFWRNKCILKLKSCANIFLQSTLLEVDRIKFCKTFWSNKCVLKLKSCVNFCPQSHTPDFEAYTCVINNPYLSIGIHSVTQIRIALIPLITYTLPNDLATHNNANAKFCKFKTYLLPQITDDSVKKITAKTVC